MVSDVNVVLLMSFAPNKGEYFMRILQLSFSLESRPRLYARIDR